MTEKLTFQDLGLSEKLLHAIDQKGFEEPTAIQAMTIPVMLENKHNIIAQAQTGTGKTAAFGLPLIELVNAKSTAVQALILAPTRELAIQVSEEINSLKGKKAITTMPIYGGQSFDQQLRRLRKGVQVVVGTPGRVIDHLHRGTLKLDRIEHLVLDEADEMLNMGFIDAMEEIFKHTNPNKRTLLFSATMPAKIKDLAKRYMDGYELLSAKKEQLTTNLTEQIYYELRPSDRFEALCRIIDIEADFHGLVFCRTRSDVDAVAQHLKRRGYDAEPIHGEVSQSQRERTLSNFREKRVNILVATDVAARGIDVDNLTHVINYALPQDPEAYVHRIGRTGRAGREGTAITFITPNEYRQLMFIQRIAKADIKKSSAPTVDEIIEAKRRKIEEDLAESLSGGDEGDKRIDSKFYSWAKRLLAENHPTEVLAAVLNHCFEDALNPSVYGEITESTPKGKYLDQQGKTRLFVALGRRDRVGPRQLVEIIRSRVSIRPRDISEIQLLDTFSFITVPFAKAEEIVQSFRQKGRKPLVTHVNADGSDSKNKGGEFQKFAAKGKKKKKK